MRDYKTELKIFNRVVIVAMAAILLTIVGIIVFAYYAWEESPSDVGVETYSAMNQHEIPG